MLYGQSNLWQKSAARSNKAYAVATDMSGQDVVMVWDEAHASRLCRDMDLDMRGEARDAFHRAYGVSYVYKCSAVDAKKLMKAGARVIVTSVAVTVGIKSYEEVTA